MLGRNAGPLVGPAFNSATAICEHYGDGKADVELGTDGHVKGVGYPVLELLRVAGLEDGAAEGFEEEAGIGGNLCGFAPGIVTGNDDGPAGLKGNAGKVAKRERVGGNVKAHGLENGDRFDPDHLSAIDHGNGKSLVIGHAGGHALFLQQPGNVVAGVKKPRNRGAGVAGQERNAAGGLQAAFENQLRTGVDFTAAFDQESRVNPHVASSMNHGISTNR